MSAQNSRAVDYFRFTECCDHRTTVACRHQPAETATFCFGDDKWVLLDLLEPHERGSDARTNFSTVASWVREDAKRFVARLWLRTEPSIMDLQQVMVALRDLGRHLPGFSGRPIELRARHARPFSRSYCKRELCGGTYLRTARIINRFMDFVKQQHREVDDNDFRIVFPKFKTASPQHRPLEKSKEAKIETDRLAMIIDACIADVEAYRKAKEGYIDPAEHPVAYRAKYDRERYLRKKQGLPNLERGTHLSALLGRAIKAQVIILAICVGRRASALCYTPFNVRTELTKWTNEAGMEETGVMVRFREMKIRNVDEDVACPNAFGELALRAIETAKELTQDLRRLNPRLKKYLFIVPTKKMKVARMLRPQQINQYLNGQGGNEQGIRQRYGIPGGKITTHNFRATRATVAWMGGLQVHEVAYDLGHATAEMTVRHYIVGNDESRRRLQFLMDHGALSGALEDLVGGREIIRTRLSKRHVEIMRRQGRVLSPTRYGYCALPASSGPCPTGNVCYLGPDGSGKGCEHHVLSPDALPAYAEDKEVLDCVITEYEGDPQYVAWVQNHRNLLVIVNRDIEHAKNLQARIGNCGGPEACKCRDRVAQATGGAS